MKPEEDKQLKLSYIILPSGEKINKLEDIQFVNEEWLDEEIKEFKKLREALFNSTCSIKLSIRYIDKLFKALNTNLKNPRLPRKTKKLYKKKGIYKAWKECVKDEF